MSLAALLNQEATLVHRAPTGTDRHRNQTIAETSREAVLGYLEQTDATEILVGRNTYISNWRWYGRADVTYGARDQLVVDGVTYEIVGQPNGVRNPRTTATSHIEMNLRTTDG